MDVVDLSIPGYDDSAPVILDDDPATPYDVVDPSDAQVIPHGVDPAILGAVASASSGDGYPVTPDADAPMRDRDPVIPGAYAPMILNADTRTTPDADAPAVPGDSALAIPRKKSFQ